MNSNSRKPTGLSVRIQQDLRILRSAYSGAVSGNSGGAMEWLRDNYYLLEREGRAARAALRHCGRLPYKDGAPEIYSLCLKITGFHSRSPGEALHSVLKSRGRGFTTRELDFLPVILRAAYIRKAAAGIKGQAPAEEMAGAVSGLRALSDIDFEAITEEFSAAEKIFLQDPAGIYGKMDDGTKSAYRRDCARLAERRGISEEETAREAVSLAKKGESERERHVGYYLTDRSESRGRKARGIASLILFYTASAAVSILFSILTGKFYAGILIFFPVLEILRPLLSFFALWGTPVRPLPKMETEGEIPEDCPTLITVATLVPHPDKAEALCAHFEQLYRTNGRGAVRLCILADLKESDVCTRPEDKLALDALSRSVADLNRKTGGKIILAVRPRVRIRTQGKFAGYERKRGAILQLIQYINGECPEFLLLEGAADYKEFLRSVKYLIALDSDTELLMDAAAEMVAAASHPLNRPVIDPAKNIVTEGYGIFTPKISTELESGGKSAFARILSGAAGITSYDTLSGDFYQDLFGNSMFVGKGLLDVRAFYECQSGVFEDEKILSHDIIEGGFLRVGYLSEVEVVDGCPSTSAGYLSRLHRWVRGDWQNISWLFRRPQRGLPEYKNPVPPLTRYMLFDNLRRSITPVISILCLIVSFFAPDRVSVWLITAALLSAASAGLFAAVISLLTGGWQMLSRKYHSRVMPAAFTGLSQALMSTLMLVRTGFLSADAIFRALWRKLISGKNLLQWVTAADADSAKNGLFIIIKQNVLPYILAGLLLYKDSSVSRLAGILILIAPFFLWAVSRPTKTGSPQLSQNDAEKLRSHAGAMWRFYDELCGRRDNWLPPDNIQETPVHAVAHRTSPTNIGLMLLGILAARDFGFIDTKSMCLRLGRALDSIARLPRLDGNLYNWYDTKTLSPLHPRFISTVDSGNFACCLIALLEGISEYSGVPELRAIREKIEGEISLVNLRSLYNKKRRLFHIGLDAETGELSNSYYDLLMSEARMTSFYAIGTRQVPKKHWGALGRTLAREGAYAGPVSWTGTMFEYFMPHLLLPVLPNTLGYEALRFCVYCQKRRGARKNAPFGTSESGFFAFDPEYNYQYKAHGVQRLGLRRGLSEEYVVSPYSTFLTLPLIPHSALRNLDRLEALGAAGRFGFYEAVDFTSRRVGSAGMRTVRSYMAHHLGMSLISVSNLLNDNIFQKRFMRYPEMSAAGELLTERIPAGARIFDDVIRRDTPDKPGRTTSESEEFEAISPASPRVHLLSNGEWTLLLTDSGTSISTCRGADVTRRSTDLLRRPLGIFAAVCDGEASFSITRGPDYTSAAAHRAEFSGDSAAFYAEKDGLSAGMQASVFARAQCERRSFLLKNETSEAKSAELLIYFEPCLAKTRDDSAHMAFSKLFLKGNYNKSVHAISFSRISRDGDAPLFLAAGFADSRDFEFDFDRENVLTRPEGTASILSAFSRINGGKGVPDPCAALKIALTLPPKSEKSAVLLMVAASSPDEALVRLEQCRLQELKGTAGRAPSILSGGDLESRLGSALLPELFFPCADRKERLVAARANSLGIPALWQISVSGDVPIVLCELPEHSDLSRAEPYIRLHKRLRGCGIRFDLIFLYSEGGEYSKPVSGELRRLVSENSGEELITRRGGIHFVDERKAPEGIANLLRGLARHTAPLALSPAPPAFTEYTPAVIRPANGDPSPAPDRDIFNVCGGYFSPERFTLTKTPSLPWCHVLANERFGTLLSDISAGYTFAGSSRENKLTPWFNDTRTDNRGEMLIFHGGGEYYDLIRGACAEFRPDCAVYTGSVPAFSYKIKIYIENTAKKIALFINNTMTDISAEFAYYTEPVLGVDRTEARMISARWEEGRLFLKNPLNAGFDGEMVLYAEGENAETACCCDRSAFLCGRWNEHTLLPLSDPCAAVTLRKTLKKGETGELIFTLEWRGEGEIPAEIEPVRNKISVNTPDAALNFMVNDWLPVQFENSRLFGRTGFYQCGGAFGFRDQLQDICAELCLCPDIARGHILRCAARQFTGGDVLHWWHEIPAGGRTEARGVRTRCSDDMLWLPYTVCEYIEVTGDRSVLDEIVPFLEAPELDPGELERYFIPAVSSESATIYEHCLRAVKRVKTGSHGLPLIGCGDWNDGFSAVGAGGTGESVWLAEFGAIVARRLAAVCLSREDDGNAKLLLDLSESLKSAVDEHAWDGEWYLRAFFDDGTPLGGKGAGMCEIDLLPQSFAVLSGMPDRSRIDRALSNALKRLVDSETEIVRLFKPSFDITKMDESENNPGYISAYPPGVRENGGQYTHAGVWLALALLRFGRNGDGYRLLRLLSPAHRSANPELAAKYKTEPYAMAADIYSCEDAAGRGGWTLYTGAAAWYWRVIVQELLGIRQRGGHLEIQPNIPDEWKSFTGEFDIGRTRISLTVKRGPNSLTTVDGEESREIPLDRRPHEVIVELSERGNA